MHYETLGNGFRRFCPKSVPTVTFNGDRRLCFHGAAMKLLGPKTEAVEVYVNRGLGLVAFRPTHKSNPYGLTLAARGKESRLDGIYAKRISFGGILEELKDYPWGLLTGKKFVLSKSLIGGRTFCIVNLTQPL